MRGPLPWVVALSLVAAGLGAQTPAAPGHSNRVINLPSAFTLGTTTLQVVFTHRFSQTIADGGAGNLFGLDSAADIGLGLELGLSKRVEVELYRSSFLKQLEGAAKWAVLRQDGGVPISVAVRLGADYRSARGIADRWSGFAQAVIARRLGRSFEVMAVPCFASDTPELRNAFNVGIAAIYDLAHGWSARAELIPENHDARRAQTAWAFALNKRIGGHDFLLYLGNSRATTADLITGSDLPGGFRGGDVRLGFNLLRRFPE